MFQKVFEYAGPHKKGLYAATTIVLVSVLMGVLPFVLAYQVIAPLVMGAGIKVKVLEALSAGVPLLTNEIGMEGIDAENEKEYFHCQTAGDYIRVLDTFFDSEDKLNAMSIAEKKFVKNNFNKMTSYERYRASLLHIAGEK